MSNVDKNQAIIDYLLTCEPIKNSPLYFNFAQVKNGINQFMPLTQDKNIERPYIDGSVKKRYSMTLITFLTISSNPIVKEKGIDNENVTDLKTVQKLIDWIDIQNLNSNFPDFGSSCEVESIYTTTSNPRLDQIDSTTTSPIAKYSFTIIIEYIDTSKVIWN